MAGRSRGTKAPWYQDWLAHPDPGDPWWDQVIYTGDAAGNPARITVGPWHHGSFGMFRG